MGRVIKADKQPGILALGLGSQLRTAREAAGLSYDEAAARLDCEADWLIRVETGFAVATPEEVADILAGYGLGGTAPAGKVIDLARRAAAPPSWLAPHTSRMTASDRDLILIEAEATLARVYGCRLIPLLVQTEDYFREIERGIRPESDADQEWELLSHRQAHRPGGAVRRLDVIIDESALGLKLKRPENMAGQLRHLLALADSPHATVRVAPMDAPLWEKRAQNFDILSFGDSTARISVSYTALGPILVSVDAYDIWAHIEATCAADPGQSRVIIQRHLAALA